MKKYLFILFFLFITYIGYSQTTFTQTFVDRCTGDVQVVTANFVEGSAVVAFYDEVRLFTYQEFINGTLQQWLIEKYNWWQALSPCSQAQQQTQQAQQTAQTATQSIPSPPSNTSTTTSETTNSNSSTTTDNTDSGTKSNTDDTTSTEQSESESESTNETSEESEEVTEESIDDDEDSSDDESSSDDDGESTDEEESDEEETKKMMPIQLKADLMTQQSLLGGYNAVLNFGASQSSIFGDVNYNANLMVWDNLKQISLSVNRTKITFNDEYQASWIDATSVSYMRNYKMNSISISLSRMKPLGKWGTIGVGLNYASLFGNDTFDEKMPTIHSIGWNILYTNMFKVSERITYTPTIIMAQNPISYTQKLNDVIDNPISTISKDVIGIFSNSFTTQLTRRFSVNVGWTLIYSTNEFVPVMNAFMIGSKLPF